MKTQRIRAYVREPQLSLPPYGARSRFPVARVAVLVVPGALLVLALLVLFLVIDVAPGFRAMMLLLVAGLSFGIPFLGSLLLSLRVGSVRIAADAPLTFVALDRTWIYPIVGAALMTASGVLGVAYWLIPGVEVVTSALGRRGGPVVILGLGLALLMFQLKRFRRQRGLRLDPVGLSWRQGGRALLLPWNEIDDVSMQTGANGTAKVFRVRGQDGHEYNFAPALLGSDPYVVAEAVHYFWKRPATREILRDPHRALSLVLELGTTRAATSPAL